MKKIIPIIAEEFPKAEILWRSGALFSDGKWKEKFVSRLEEMFEKPHAVVFNSGIAGFLVLLEALKDKNSRDEVILPAYTAASLGVAVYQAGLKPVLCDISPDDFNMDTVLASTLINDRTLCVAGVYMFGIATGKYKDLQKAFPRVPVIEDCAQAFGSQVNGRYAGSLTDTSFFSFNRGKNLPTMGGGCVMTSDEALAQALTLRAADLSRPGGLSRIKTAFKQQAFSLVVRPSVYGAVHSLIARFKENAPPEEIVPEDYTDYQAMVGLSLLDRKEDLLARKHVNGTRLIQALNAEPGVRVPRIALDSSPVYSRCPVVFDDPARRARVEQELKEEGVETSRMYLKPLHHFFNLGCAPDDFPRACHLARGLLTLPTHSLVGEDDIETMIAAIKRSR